MFHGNWGGTMCLTEPHAGSDVGVCDDRGHAQRRRQLQRSSGTKIFISGGDHDLAENIVHMVLARIDGAPAGTKGLTLFIVPKLRVNADGSLGEPNDVIVGVASSTRWASTARRPACSTSARTASCIG